ncbi:hypothetical protein HYU45_02665 [Candidatus Daviesbacteria bacterium]|nr:hypothetical protein [Candidatus Daviesbacteria bacterium]
MHQITTGNIIGYLKFTFIYDLAFPVFQIIRTIDWHLKKERPNTPHLIKQHTIKSYQKTYKTPICIETGTYLGMMVKAVKNNFSKIYTIELDKKLFKNAKRKFAHLKQVKVINGDSSKILPRLLKKINQPALFWLDAHYSKGITAKGSKNTPIAAELTFILNHKITNHVILIDDADVFNGKNDYPPLKFLRSLISKNYPNLFFKVKDNIIRITPKHLSRKADKKHS